MRTTVRYLTIFCTMRGDAVQREPMKTSKDRWRTEAEAFCCTQSRFEQTWLKIAFHNGVFSCSHIRQVSVASHTEGGLLPAYLGSEASGLIVVSCTGATASKRTQVLKHGMFCFLLLVRDRYQGIN